MTFLVKNTKFNSLIIKKIKGICSHNQIPSSWLKEITRDLLSIAVRQWRCLATPHTSR